jgi:hypothetical protein
MAMTTHDQNKKTLRHFQCRDYLWDIFEQMSTELECSTDYLINEAMRQYARSRNYGTARSGGTDAAAVAAPDAAPRTDTPLMPPAANAAYVAAAAGSGTNAAAPAAAPMGAGIPSLRDNAAQRGAIPSPPPPRPRIRTDAGNNPSRAPTAPTPIAAPIPAPPPKRPTGSSLSAAPPPPPPPGSRITGAHRAATSMTNPPPLPGPARPPTAPRSRALYIIFNGQKIPVTKDEFVIGRGSKSADLAIKDGNISRRHAAVVLHNGAYYLKDLGSTNGVEFQGRRFDSKRIEDGDLFRICDYELRFTYQ